jgi:hypothetical protein
MMFLEKRGFYSLWPGSESADGNYFVSYSVKENDRSDTCKVHEFALKYRKRDTGRAASIDRVTPRF